MNEKLKLALLVLSLGVLWGGYEFYDFYSVDQAGMEQEIITKKQELETAKNELNKFKDFAEGITEIKSKLKKTNAEFEEALEFIPRNLELSKLLARLNVLARNSGVEIESFKPAKDSNVKSEQEEAKNSFFQTTTIELQMQGGFSQTVMFFDQISRLKRILNVESLKMLSQSTEDKRTLASNITKVDTQVVLKTYRFSE